MFLLILDFYGRVWLISSIDLEDSISKLKFFNY